MVELALVRYAMELLRSEGHKPVVPPALVREEALSAPASSRASGR